MGSVANQRYLGHYQKLFGNEQEQQVPTWPTLARILEDYGLSWNEFVATDLINNQRSPPWLYCHSLYKYTPKFVCAKENINGLLMQS